MGLAYWRAVGGDLGSSGLGFLSPKSSKIPEEIENGKK